ncbi:MULTISPECIES: nitrous oxide reductase accessory protein NosL [Aequorivita]|uniref:Nitrous oxide reductase accessory protein NosL n=1 Tax=Aequorivita iocasae TaxID=2803865 RepID=A0ABX7DNV5_9FLAO|nr:MULTISPECIES: nitrous oxide reductase accessory protein NosL [Aequorivita]QQX75810.1 nitrous oxide reductase accessory protein NosL [Aequorivita iocasae]UCA55270.1 nitrous oxide reductase accessory protein NosL [Aequorivita sp. F7]
MKLFFLLSIITVLLVSCNVSPQHIEYGTDACHYCNMTIVDRQHAAQLVTTKGKAFKYDAIECMVHSLQDDKNDSEIALYLVADFNQAGQLIDATMAFYLVSEQITSPMGANLSAFENEKSAQNAKQKFTGEVFSWEKIQKHLKQ